MPNLVRGFEANAVMEVDLRLTRDGAWVCLHNPTLELETTGDGPVALHTSDHLRSVRMRKPSGEPTCERVIFLDDLVELAGSSLRSQAEIQLDVKVGAAAISDDILERFRRDVGPVCRSFSLSAEEPAALERLRRSAPGPLPVTLSASAQLRGATGEKQFEAGMADVLAQLDNISMVWLNHRILQAAYRTGFDLVGFAHQRGVGVDTGTIDHGSPGWQGALDLALSAGVDRITTNSPCELADQMG